MPQKGFILMNFGIGVDMAKSMIVVLVMNNLDDK